ncbi:hypothetical protein JAAARDRAFT_54398 [Jaapia argillacea MUCL 33604]|uniref:ABM domain-containing protein n=1 Tax=Jaapia argillacea MUCL 33604 TaxID=933084 RepID=A0A067Q5Z1_9AGAM|nr:hypothetical protein JAAARDRAFT_54398 [Jaapia argillacea MUCL 33604]
MPGPHVVEVCLFPAKEGYQNDPKVMHDAFSYIYKVATGLNYIYHGFQTEDKNNGYFFLSWATYQDHKKLMDDTELYPPLISKIVPHLAGPLDMVHVEFKTDPLKSFKAPATEIAIIKPKSPEQKAQVLELMKELEKRLNEAPYEQSCAWGQGIEEGKQDTIVLVVGWDSVQDHWDQVDQSKGYQPLVSVVQKAFQVADLDVKHARLIRYSP